MKLTKKSRIVLLIIVFIVLIGILVTGIVYNHYNSTEQWGFYGNVFVKRIIERIMENIMGNYLFDAYGM